MHLERVEIVGFRGINRLSLMLEQNNVLIGENAWGKSSLLDALTLLLSPEFDLYHFVRDDFWFPPGDIQGREHHLHIILTFRENEPGRHRVRRFRPLSDCWVPCDDGYQRIFYRLEGELADDGSVMTLRSFINCQGEALEMQDIDNLARHLVRLMPVLRLRDARFMRRIHNGTVPHSPQIEITARQLDFFPPTGQSSAKSHRWANPRRAVGDGATAGTLFRRAEQRAKPQSPDAPPFS